MNIIKHPEDALPGSVVTKGEFEEMAIEAGMMEDLMELPDGGEFLDQAVLRANARRTPQALHLWVFVPHLSKVFLVESRLVYSIKTLCALTITQQKVLETTRDAIAAMVKP